MILNPRKILLSTSNTKETVSQGEGEESCSMLKDYWICYDGKNDALIQLCNCKGDVSLVHQLVGLSVHVCVAINFFFTYKQRKEDYLLDSLFSALQFFPVTLYICKYTCTRISLRKIDTNSRENTTANLK